ncbi:hypothetical protein BV898_12334 [Hypsibius exemplaris]|uniref:Uncharacterized protein n=1 Tax=Hypsibius exemplaris TaxID=2072580 RepID=A0A1W0WED5_HYPEX|nr:hypothetical protein BV898_12334 [Hypsibius exemplaris]
MALPPKRPTDLAVDLSSDSGVSESDSGTPPSDAPPVASPDLPQNDSGIATTIPPKLSGKMYMFAYKQPGSQETYDGNGKLDELFPLPCRLVQPWREDESKEKEEKKTKNLEAEIAVVERALELSLERKPTSG